MTDVRPRCDHSLVPRPKNLIVTPNRVQGFLPTALGAAETSGNIIPFALLGVGVAVAAVWLLASGSKKKTWFPLFHNVKSRTEAVRLSKLNRYDWPKQKAQQEADGTWSVLAWDLPSEAVRSTNWNR